MSDAAKHLRIFGASKGSIRILALGDCNTNTVDPRQGTAADGLADALTTRGYDTTLANLSGGMASSREGLAQVLNYVRPADLAIINFGLVDSWVTTIPRIYVPYYPDNHIRKRLRKLLKSVKRKLRGTLLRNLVPTGPVVPPDEFTRNIRAILRTVWQCNPLTEVFLWGTLPVEGNAERNVGIAEYNGLLKQVALTDSATFIDVEEVLAAQPVHERFIDGVHLSPDSARLIGEHISDLYLNRQPQRVESRNKNA